VREDVNVRQPSQRIDCAHGVPTRVGKWDWRADRVFGSHTCLIGDRIDSSGKHTGSAENRPSMGPTPFRFPFPERRWRQHLDAAKRIQNQQQAYRLVRHVLPLVILAMLLFWAIGDPGPRSFAGTRQHHARKNALLCSL
jgi:hypothetical protein